MMKKTLSLFLCLVLMMSLCSTAMASDAHCKYWSENSPCDPQWRCNSKSKIHALYCERHVENKEDPLSHVKITDPESCVIVDNVCTICGHDYTPQPTTDPYSQEEALAQLANILSACGPDGLKFTVSGAEAKVSLHEMAMEIAYAMGIEFSESMLAPATYTLKLSGTSFAATGSAIKPASLNADESVVTAYLQENGFLTISAVTYENNVEPGTATAKVTFSMPEFDFSKELSVNFTITGTSSGGSDTGSGDSGNTGSGDDEQFTTQTITSGDVHLWGSMSQDARLIVTPIGSGNSGYQKLAAHPAAQGKEKIAAYDVSILGEYVGEMELGFVVDDKYLGKELTILHGKSDGLVESHTVTVTENRRGTCAIIRIDSLSPFMLLGEKAEATPTPVPAVTAAPTQAPEATAAPGGTANTAPTAAPTATLTPTETPGAVELPATGDSSQLALWMALLLVSCIGVVLLNAAKRTGRQ